MVAPPSGCEAATFAGAGVALQGWRCPTSARRRGTVIYLHGIADNRTSAAGVIDRFGRRGFDVLAYDSRAHGESAGDVCTYGVFEKADLRTVMDSVAPGPVVLIGTSLGAAVALQAAAADDRIGAVVAAETFSDLRTVATERAPFFFTPGIVNNAFRLAEAEGHFRVDEASPVAVAARIAVPVFLIHGATDVETPPEHSRRVAAALKGTTRLLLVPGVGHNQSLIAVWEEVERWLNDVL